MQGWVNLVRALVSFILSARPPEPAISPDERARVERAWDEVFARMSARRSSRS